MPAAAVKLTADRAGGEIGRVDVGVIGAGVSGDRCDQGRISGDAAAHRTHRVGDHRRAGRIPEKWNHHRAGHIRAAEVDVGGVGGSDPRPAQREAHLVARQPQDGAGVSVWVAGARDLLGTTQVGRQDRHPLPGRGDSRQADDHQAHQQRKRETRGKPPSQHALLLSSKTRTPCRSNRTCRRDSTHQSSPLEETIRRLASSTGSQETHQEKFERPTARSVDWCSTSIWSAPDRSGLLTVDACSV